MVAAVGLLMPWMARNAVAWSRPYSAHDFSMDLTPLPFLALLSLLDSSLRLSAVNLHIFIS